MRAVINSLLAFLLLVALFCGNCFCCVQVPSHSCCEHSGQQPVSSPTNCRSIALRHFVTTNPAPQAQFHVLANAPMAVAGTPISPPAPKVIKPVIPHSPLDLEVLNSNIRI